MSATPSQVQKPLSIPRQSSDIFRSPSPSISPRPSFNDTRSAAASKLGGMQLGGAKKGGPSDHSSSLANALAAEFEDDADTVGDAWGDGDLMDVNADGDDWSEYEVLRQAQELTGEGRCI